MTVAERSLTVAKNAAQGGPRPVLWSKPQYYRMAEMGWPLQAAFGDGYFVSNQCPLDLGPVSDPEPDFAVISGDPRDYQSLPRTAALVVEVSASTLAYDRTVKASLYARAGLNDYWIVNLEARQLEVHRQPMPDADLPYGFRYAEIVAYQPGEVIIPLTASGATIAVADLLP